MKAKYENYTIVQASNNHIAIFKNNKLIFHSSFDKKLNYEQLLEYLVSSLKFFDEIGEKI